MLEKYSAHNHYQGGLSSFQAQDPHLLALSKLQYQHRPDWWKKLDLNTPGIYILTGGRQVGKSTSCKLLIEHALQSHSMTANNILYLPCDEIFSAQQLSEVIRHFISETDGNNFLLVIDEITFVKDWDRVIKALADEGLFKTGVALLTGSDSLILKEAAMSFPGRRGTADQTDFHLYPLTFKQYVALCDQTQPQTTKEHFQNYLISGGYLRAINDLAEHRKVTTATYQTYEQWIRGDFAKQGKHEKTLIALLQALLTISVTPMSYSALTQKIGLISKDTCIDYCHLLERMDVLFELEAFDQNKKMGFPRKARKFHFLDPFIINTIFRWLQREGLHTQQPQESHIAEAVVASHCKRLARSFYAKAAGEIDVIWLPNNQVQAVEVKWSEQVRANDLKMLKNFKHATIVSKQEHAGTIENIQCIAVYDFLLGL